METKSAEKQLLQKITFLTLIGLFLLTLPLLGQINLLHKFVTGANDGGKPYGSLILSGTTLYGMTAEGGESDLGTIFKIQIDGSGFTLLHEFAGGSADGAGPDGSFILSGTTIYGMTSLGGDNNYGTIFRIETNGNNYTLLHEFAHGPADGAYPKGALILSGSTLYGMTENGGTNGSGTIFKIETNGTGFALLHSFLGGAADGREPNGSLILSGTTFYGLTQWGGDNDIGTIFTIGIDGSGFTLLHEFAGSPTDGAIPEGALVLSGTALYGMTNAGGDSNFGTIFKILIDGSGFTLLHEFPDGVDDGRSPQNSLVLSSESLFGMTYAGGNSDFGTIFKIKTDGTGYSLLHEFTNGPDDGAEPKGSLIISGLTLYGMTPDGGDDGWGVIFSLPLPGIIIDHSCTDITKIPEANILAAKENLHIAYGHTSHGSQLTDNMTALVAFMNGKGYPNNLYAWSHGGAPGAIDLHDYAMGGDVGYYPDWVNNTRSYLGAVNPATGRGTGDNADVNVIIWSWCGQASSLTEGQMTSNYLAPMSVLEAEYWGVKFVYMTGHLDGSGSTGNLNVRNDQIRIYCQLNNKTLYDFADIESYDPDALVHYMPLLANDNCDYDSDGNGSQDRNWATVWQNSHTENVDWFNCSTAHSQPLNGNRKAYAAWWLWARLAGWNGIPVTPQLTVMSPNGGENWNSGDDHDITWTSAGAIANVNIEYSINNGSTWASMATSTANDGVYAWTVPAITPSTYCLVRVNDAANAATNDVSDSVFSISSSAAETVSTPGTPTGPSTGSPAANYDFTTGGSTSNSGHTVQYKFDWDDGSDSGWLAEGTTQTAHSWAANDTYHVRAMARCVTHTAIESLWSDTHAIVISTGGVGAHFNSPAQRLILPEVNWASSSGGGDWISEVQIVDVTGGSVVQVYYNGGANRRGPFTLWSNGSGAAGSSASWSNMLQTIDGLDAGVFTYYGTGGSLELITQDGSHKIQAAIRSYNGNYSRTFPALADVETNTAALGRTMVVPNMSMDTNFRPSLVLFNPSADSVTADVQIINSNGSQVGSTVVKTVAGYEMTGVAGLRDNTYSNADFRVTVTGGSGRLIVSGQSANNTSNDPAAHVAVQTGTGYVNSPTNRLIFPEVNWASSSGGGDWISELHITDMSGGAIVQVYYNSGTNRRGPFTLWTNSSGANCSVTFSNILQTIDNLDAGVFTYYGTGGALELVTQDGSHLIQAALKGYNGNVTRTFPAFQDVEANTAAIGRDLLIPNISNDTTYRPSVAMFNPSADSATVEVRIIGANGVQIGSTIDKTVSGYEMSGVVGLRSYTYSNAFIRITVTIGSGRVIASGQSANNTSNDPAAHIAVQGE
jgi:uncharacterized repeat protein (TIGR03803 family)